jgi:addiction module RelE/StbE family toxin
MAYVILFTPEFKRDYRKLPSELKERLKERGRLFQENPFHPLLRTHKLTGVLKECWAYSVDFRVRVIFQFVSKTEIVLLRVGDHSIYRKK